MDNIDLLMAATYCEHTRLMRVLDGANRVDDGFGPWHQLGQRAIVERHKGCVGCRQRVGDVGVHEHEGQL
jgi:hypothetical protein